ncbi:MAG TPA: pilin [Candidatus Paceibacterota bacterium]|nr:pilin [Candidatus Paceibacterota bacterium]
MSRALPGVALALALALTPALGSVAQAQVACPTSCPGSCNPTTGVCLSGGSGQGQFFDGSSGSSYPLGGGSGIVSGGGFPTPNTSELQQYTGSLTSFVNTALVPVLVAIAFIMFLWGVANAYILHPGDEERRKSGHQFILWGIIGFVVIFSVWGLVNLVSDALGLSGAAAPPPPGASSSYGSYGSGGSGFVF